ncbi:MAG TPA: hypothetical protein VJ818_04555 [Actinomycetota bacterium]|nr:hypothetical protein [Actinomycetota bacterium]
MLSGIKTRAVWMAVGIVLGGGALSYAGVAVTTSHAPNPKSSIHATPNVDDTESPEPSESPEPKGSADANRPQNHGFYVSQAAACKNVDDTVNKISFTAPSDCATNGQAHGQYVSTVARSDIGKGAHGNAKSHSPNH